MEGRLSDNYPINVKPINWREQYIIDEAKAWLDENIFKSNLNPEDEHIQNVINLGRDVALPFLFELLRENNHEEGMYMWFCSMCISDMLKDEITIEGYMPIMEWTKNMLSLYDSGIIMEYILKDDK